MTVCPACAGENADDARFCSQCGRPLAAGDAGGKAERRVVTVLFADITGSTPLGEALDPEDLTEVLGAYATAMREEIEAEGGTVEKFIGDAVMAAFGVPLAHEDDPSRALRAALRMRRRLGQLNVELERRFGVGLEMRVGVNTGDVVVTPEAGPEVGMVTGDAVNAAARLEQAADPGQVLVSERTARSARGFRFGDVGPLDLRGKSRPIETVELLEGVEELPGTPERGLPGLRAPMVGRDSELDLLRSLYGRLASSGRAQLVTIYGDPGIGKSRLTRELLAWSVAGLFLVTAIVLAWLYFKRPAVVEPAISFVVAMPKEAIEVSSPVISPDGRTLLFHSDTGGDNDVYSTSANPSDKARPSLVLSAPGNQQDPKFSPDGAWITCTSTGRSWDWRSSRST